MHRLRRVPSFLIFQLKTNSNTGERIDTILPENEDSPIISKTHPKEFTKHVKLGLYPTSHTRFTGQNKVLEIIS